MALQPDLVLIILCGVDESRSREELDARPDGPPRRRIAAVLPLLFLAGALACAAPDPVVAGIRRSETVAGTLHLRAAWGLQPFTNAPLPGYLRIVNLGTSADTLLAVRSEMAETARLHGTVSGAEGRGMQMLDGIVVPPGDSS